MIVMKFGGTSVSSKQNLEHIESILLNKDDNYIIVVSAFSQVTNKLENLARQALNEDVSDLLEEIRRVHFELIGLLFTAQYQTELHMKVQQKCTELEAICKGINILKELSPRTLANVSSFGEQLSAVILHKYLESSGSEINLLDSSKLIRAEGDYLNATVDLTKTTKAISEKVTDKNYIAGGFIASNKDGEIVTLGRGGSDYSASIYAHAVDAKYLEIWSDVSGMHSANPKIVGNTVSIKKISYEEAFEMAYFGAKVLYPSSILPLIKKDIPLYLKNTLSPEDEGTFISNENKSVEHKIHGLSSLDHIAMITISGIGLAKKKGSARRVFQALEEVQVNIVLITQSCSEQSIGMGIDQKNMEKAEAAINQEFSYEIEKGLINPVSSQTDKCIIALIGDNMRHKVGLCGKVFGAIGENGINITAIAQGASERNISIVIDRKDEAKALNVIHEKFFSNVVKDVHLFIAGVGNVGSEFLKIIADQKETLIEEYGINLKVVGVANSTRMLLIDGDELNHEDILSIKEKGKEYGTLSNYLDEIIALNLRNSIFIDNTASEVVSSGYAQLLENSISVVTCNKIACSSEYELYARLKSLAKEHNCSFKYETSVGAALPIIKTIHDLNISGDKIHKIEAVISGSLNFIFNEYNGENKFADVVLKAKEDGYTEPNPLIDLSGLDVMRKILILSRESGLNRELSDITFNDFLPKECSDSADVPSFFNNLEKHEAHFKELYSKATSNENKLKVLATLENGKLSVALNEISSDSPFYNLEGKDNVVAINTNRYAVEPLVIKGAGAGANITASGVFSDLMQIINN
ncbi:bifunctional aspartate kinase/homoserine dehydrogenase I [Cryomorphaceae bacterium 1068]|nr:bifunctional aspartate kinase/homoserine dehydrogenase I [Cryomorphaceae bacterium 1068]